MLENKKCKHGTKYMRILQIGKDTTQGKVTTKRGILKLHCL